MKNQEYDKNSLEHLRMLQGIISRIANTSLAIKRYSLIVFTFACAYLVINPKNKSVHLLFLSIFIFVMMIFFDMYYLSMERAYRKKYNENRLNPDSFESFDLSISRIKTKKYIKCILSKSIFLFYFPLLIFMLILYYII